MKKHHFDLLQCWCGEVHGYKDEQGELPHMGHKVNNREVVLVQTVYDRLSPKYRYATFGFEAENGNPCVSIGINDDGNRAVVWISLQDFSDVAALLDEIRYQNDRNFSKPLD